MKRLFIKPMDEQGKNTALRSISYAVLSFAFILFGYMISVSITPEICLGDRILESLGLRAWQSHTEANSGLHYTIFYGLSMIVLGWVMARITLKHRQPKLYKSIPVIILSLLFMGPLVLSRFF
ncbi:hypothetical protein P4H66_10790 [Paenibacillus dokdonensis]|uniref:Uncharacterized protein n=1 Tax=Paenibacillus dokdonensis TaxID=2567944 RepID=A0ABU6GKR0_9BACL|nr:hypothetical protein [Paenibacillus dokdonensis]MEC0240336.1 hypothetical protein [Paenibacillus dokdonensis]